jgi:hypothetical protein
MATATKKTRAAPHVTRTRVVSGSAFVSEWAILIPEDNRDGYHPTLLDQSGESLVQSRSFDDIDAGHYLG